MTEKDNKEKESLDDLFNQATSKQPNDSKVKKDMIKKDKDRKYTPYIICGAVAILLAGGIFYAYPKLSGNDWIARKTTDSTLVSGTKDKGETSDTSSSKDGTSESDNGAISTDDSKEIDKAISESKGSIEVEDWTKTPYATQMNEDPDALYESAVKSAQDTTFINFSNMLPSATDGYTDDTDKATEGDGSPNLNYSYQTKENIEYSFSVYSQRILNPVFGEWYALPVGNAQALKDGFPQDLMQDMFTERWWNSNVSIDDHTKLPLYLDWAGDSYGGLNFEMNGTLGVWYGKITTMSITGEAMEDGSGMYAEVNADVEFTAILNDKSTVTRKGTLYMKLVPNTASKDKLYRNLIDEVKLTVNS